jgi:mono/diheme cytochrome c family protein
MIRTALLTCFLAVAQATFAQSVNWANDIAPILYKHCVQCHRAEAIGGFSLMDYQSAFTNRYAIQEAVSNKTMPPWKADPNYRHYAGENFLTDAQIQTIDQWVNNDAPSGDVSQAPQPPTFVSGSSIGIPDEVLQTPAYTMNATEDEYRCFVIPSGLTQTQYLRGLEVIPGNHMAVHHVLIYEDVSGQAKLLDQQTPEPGYVSFGGIGIQNTRLIGSWVPGNRPTLLPPFMGIKLSAGADIVVQVHFPGSATGLTDQSTLNLFFTPTTQGIRQVNITPFLYHFPPSLQNGPLYIPANETKEFKEQFTIPQNASVMAVAPHMHLIGRNVKSFGITPEGDTIRLINIPSWDFNWQGAYTFQKVQKIPGGTKVYAYATYDNTENNPFNPSSPPQAVSQGEATTDEMMLVYFIYMGYQQGDEDIVLDSTLLSSNLPFAPLAAENLAAVTVGPNPTKTFATVSFELTEADEVAFSLHNAQGQVVRELPATSRLPVGKHQQNLDVAGLPAGFYTLQLRNKRGGVYATMVAVE